jgi:septum site-determining protein MinC
VLKTGSQGVAIKGIGQGLLITLGDNPFEQALNQLSSELERTGPFFHGSQATLAVGRRSLERDELARVQELLEGHQMDLWAVLAEREETREAARSLGLATRLAGSRVDLEGRLLGGRADKASEPAQTADEPAAPGNGLLLRETLRSGRSVFHPGHVIVIGDVNPGAEVIAGGDVVVWGRLRGLVHAGAMGDASAVICALELIPTQLRVAGHIAVSPHGQGRPSVPEKASVKGDQIVAESWDSRA